MHVLIHDFILLQVVAICYYYLIFESHFLIPMPILSYMGVVYRVYVHTRFKHVPLFVDLQQLFYSRSPELSLVSKN
jgi:hypothetical protein